MSEKIPWNYLKGQWKEKGCLPTGYKQYEAHFRNGTAGSGATVPPLTAAQEKAVREAIASRQAASNPGATYAGADFQSLIEVYRDRKNCGYVQAFEAILKTAQGQAAHRAFLKAKNPGIEIE